MFDPELMKEFGMIEKEEKFGDKKLIECLNTWYRHNLAPINAIFYRNLVIALDNAILRGE